MFAIYYFKELNQMIYQLHKSNDHNVMPIDYNVLTLAISSHFVLVNIYSIRVEKHGTLLKLVQQTIIYITLNNFQH